MNPQDIKLNVKSNPELNNQTINSESIMRVNVHLNFLHETVLIKDVPTNRTKDLRKIFLAPIIDHIKKIGKQV